MKSLNEMCYGLEPATLEQRMKWVEELYRKVQVYRALEEAIDSFPEAESRSFHHAIGRRNRFLEEYLPPLRNNG